jgi:hypothetical protein
MVPNEIYVKTALGLEQVRSLKESLSPAMRIAFFMVDGLAPAEEILDKLSGLGVTSEDIDRLISSGFIAPRDPPQPAPRRDRPVDADAPPREREAAAPAGTDYAFIARQFMNETVVNAVGLRSFFFILKLEKASTLKDLRLLLADYAKLIEKGTGSLEAEMLTRRARELTQEGGPRKRGDPKG